MAGASLGAGMAAGSMWDAVGANAFLQSQSVITGQMNAAINQAATTTQESTKAGTASVIGLAQSNTADVKSINGK